MITIFATLIAAILLWTGNQTEHPSDLLNAEVAQGSSITEHEIKSNNSNLTATEILEEKSTDIKNAEPEISNIEESQSNHDVSKPKPQTAYVAIPGKATKADSIQKSKSQTPPARIKCDIKMVVANRELLEKLGFQFIGKSAFYKNKWGETDLEQVNYTYRVTEYGAVLYNLGHSNKYHENDAAVWTKNNFYPVAESYRSGELKSNILSAGDFEMANDTLFPIYCPQGLVNFDPNDKIFWFHITDDFIQQLPVEKQTLAKRINEIKAIKSTYPEINLVDYSQEPLVDSSTFIELSQQELFNVGFSVELDSTHYTTNGVYVKTSLLCYKFVKDTVTVGIKYKKYGSATYRNKYFEEFNDHPDLSFITNIKGDFEYKFDNKDLTETQKLVPILILQKQFENEVDKDRVYWFILSDKLFNALPERISKDLRKEYNYITAEDKSALVQPECKYFDECKNTLKVSSFKVFPNPANNTATVSFTLPEAIDGRITLVDLTGRERQLLQPQTTFAKGQHQIDVDVSSVPGGIYLLILYSDKGVQTQRIIVAR